MGGSFFIRRKGLYICIYIYIHVPLLYDIHNTAHTLNPAQTRKKGKGPNNHHHLDLRSLRWTPTPERSLPSLKSVEGTIAQCTQSRGHGPHTRIAQCRTNEIHRTISGPEQLEWGLQGGCWNEVNMNSTSSWEEKSTNGLGSDSNYMQSGDQM